MDLFGIGSAISGIAGAGATIAASKYNLQAQREANQANRELAEQQNQWNLEQWHRENEYNSPAAQRQRMLAAGINPLGTNFDAGNSSQLTSTNLANQQPETVDPSAIGSSIQGAASNLTNVALSYHQGKLLDAQAKKAGAETQGLTIDNFYKPSQMQEQLDVLRKQGKLLGEQAEDLFTSRGKRLQGFDLDNQLKNQQKAINMLQSYNLSAIITNTHLDNEFKRLTNRWVDALSYKDYMQGMSGTLLNFTQVNDLVQTLNARLSHLYAQSRNLNVNSDDLEATRDARIENIKSSTNSNNASAFGTKVNALKSIYVTPYEIRQMQANIFRAFAAGNLDDVKRAAEQFALQKGLSGLGESQLIDQIAGPFVSCLIGGGVMSFGTYDFTPQFPYSYNGTLSPDYSSVINP